MQCAGLLLVALAACVALQPSEAILPFASSCCTKVSPHVSRKLLKVVRACHLQRADGDCNLDAVILHVRHRRYCIAPENHTLKEWMKAQAVKENDRRKICHKKKYIKRNHEGARRGKHVTGGHKTYQTVDA
ncbi:C-C motif chemokine 28 isoform X1 [Oryctolagus cuniculus]|uniref:Chemokine interleukin-8-like domain-containing protein n=1 Tax=Oryctolagus cuniculus TaxID=9986 RepID=G1SYX0_RABIT|nr:C-C motif chemokine 28 isoform X1 [Oryctolagus cuniculus]XP_051709459.1 C-C motif chemokine 28 isoform X2 [Oryctolagus cuniculus]